MGTLPQNSSKAPARDRCQTPNYGVEPLLPYLDALQASFGRKLLIWESARGEGYLEGYLRKAGYEVHGTDIETGDDYFKTMDWRYDCEVTNVPFSRKIDWLQRACERGKPFALLMPSNTRFTVAGQYLVNKYGIEMLSPIQRLDYKMPNGSWDGTAQFHSSWLCRGLGLGKQITDVEILKGKARVKAIADGTHVSRVD